MIATQARVIVFVGMLGSGRTAASKYLTEHGYPRVDFGQKPTEATLAEAVNRSLLEVPTQTAEAIIEQIRNLHSAGQYIVCVDGLQAWDDYVALRKAFSGTLTTVGLVASRRTRIKRITEYYGNTPSRQQIIEHDWHAIEQLNAGGPLAVADSYISSEINDGLIDELNVLIRRIEERA